MSDILVIASKVKKYIKEKSGCNTSGSTMQALTDRLQQLLERGIENAKSDGRKTIMDRDIPNL